MSGLYFNKWLFGFETFSVFSRNGPLKSPFLSFLLLDEYSDNAVSVASVLYPYK